MEIFSIQLALIFEHLDEGVQAPIVIYRSIELLVALLMLFHDHLPLTQIPNHNGSLNQFVGNEMGCFMMTIFSLVVLPLGNALVYLTQVDVPTRFLFTFVTLGTDFIQLAIVVTSPLETSDRVYPPLVVDPDRQRLDSKIKGHDAGRFIRFFNRFLCPLPREGGIIVAPRIPTDGYLFESLRGFLREPCYYIGVFLWPIPAPSTSWQRDPILCDLDVGCWVTQRKEVVAWAHTRPSGLFPLL